MQIWEGGMAMLLVSYMLAAALELTIVVMAIQSQQSILVWAYGFLFVSSAVSIPVETGEAGKRIRNEMKDLGIHIDRFDMISNFLRSIVYVAVIFAVIKPVNGALLAYGVAIISLVLALHKMR